MTKPLCSIPFSRVFSTAKVYRNCCEAHPEVNSSSTDSVIQWWTSNELNQFRNKMFDSQLPNECKSCTIQEQDHGKSFRTNTNNIPYNSESPNSWHIQFGSVCNLACWTCNEHVSSTIAQHKRKLNILPDNFEDPDNIFLKRWPDLKQNILNSYNYYDTITITALGGEPIYNTTVIDFLTELVESGRARQTRLEITTNGTKLNNKLMAILDKNNWQHISVFISVDAIGAKAEWLRYGSVWKDVEKNIKFYQIYAHYIELHTFVSILNVSNLLEVYDYAVNQKIVHRITPIVSPSWLSLEKWNGKKFINLEDFKSRNLTRFYHALGQNPDPCTKFTIKKYIEQFTNRRPLVNFDPALAELLSH